MTMIKTIATLDGGIHVEMSPEEEAEIHAQQAASAAEQPRLDKLAAIAALEAQVTPRRLREALKDPTFINAIDAQITALRAQL